jgi:ethanolamine utilization protein EutA (predicted chaperonin)
MAFTSGTCIQPGPDDSCLLAAVEADGTGVYHADLTVSFSPGGTCNIVDESDTFAFSQGTLLVHSLHEDCRVHGNRIFTDFAIVGGTGVYAGAAGSGLEFGNGGAPITYNGRFD